MNTSSTSPAIVAQLEVADQFGAAIAMQILSHKTCLEVLVQAACKAGATETRDELIWIFDGELQCSEAHWSVQRAHVQESTSEVIAPMIRRGDSRSDVKDAARAVNADLDFPLTDEEVKAICREEWAKVYG